MTIYVCIESLRFSTLLTKVKENDYRNFKVYIKLMKCGMTDIRQVSTKVQMRWMSEIK